jgi:hypothetical protein
MVGAQAPLLLRGIAPSTVSSGTVTITQQYAIDASGKKIKPKGKVRILRKPKGPTVSPTTNLWSSVSWDKKKNRPASDLRLIMEGYSPGVVLVTVRYEHDKSVNKIVFEDKVRVTVCAVVSITWAKDHSTLDKNPQAGGGMRIFPGKESPTDTVKRSTVHVVAKTSPAIKGIPVYFRSIDVDDPSSNKVPLDDEKKAQDNRGTAPARNGRLTITSSTPVLTNGKGLAKNTLTVTMFAGDNFRVVAGTDKAYLAGLKAKQNDGKKTRIVDSANRPVNSGICSELLTVWRRWHIEVDSMGAPAVKTFDVRRNAQNVSYHPTLKRTGIVLAAGQPKLVQGHWRGAKIFFADGTYAWVVENFLASVFVEGDVTKKLAAGGAFALRDDHYPGNLAPQGIDMKAFREIMQQAYLYPLPFPQTLDTREDVGFQRHMPLLATTGDFQLKVHWLAARNASNANDFWTSWLLTACDPSTNEDNDPSIADSSRLVGHTWETGGVLGYSLHLPSEEAVYAVMFTETIRDTEDDKWYVQKLSKLMLYHGLGVTESRKRTAIHELVHTLGCKDETGGLFDYATLGKAGNGWKKLNEGQLNIIRSHARPGIH